MQLDPAIKQSVPKKFNRIASTYDLLTGMNPGYRRHLTISAARLGAPAQGRLLDLCCGTGLSTHALAQEYPHVEIIGLDASEGMIEKAQAKPLASRVRFVVGDAMDPTQSGVEGPFDGILMAYGIRNVPDPDTCLLRLRGLLKPGARIVFHEYSVADSFRSRALWNAITCGVIIPGGALTAGSTDIYRYLRKSVLDFDGVKAFEARLRAAGFDDVETRAMDGWQRGIVHSFVASRPSTS